MPDDPRRVLVVEDDALVRSYLTHALRRAGWVAVDAPTASTALDHLGAHDGWAAALIDGLLPDMHGIVLAQRILAAPSTGRMPLCFITGALATPPQCKAGISVLPKPVRAAALLQELELLKAWREDGASPVEERREVLQALEAEFLVGP